MSNKSRSRKRKQEIDEIINWSQRISKVVSAIVEFRSAVQRIKEMNYPKFEPGGLVCNNENSEKVVSEITRKVKVNEPHCLVYDGTKPDPEYLKNMQKLFSGKTSLMNYAKLNESKESFEMRKSILIRNPFPTIADTLPKEKGFVLTEK